MHGFTRARAIDIFGDLCLGLVRIEPFVPFRRSVRPVHRGVTQPMKPGLVRLLRTILDEFHGVFRVLVRAVSPQFLRLTPIDDDLLIVVVSTGCVVLSVIPDHGPIPSRSVLVRLRPLLPVPFADHSGRIPVGPQRGGPPFVFLTFAASVLEPAGEDASSRRYAFGSDVSMIEANSPFRQPVNVRCIRVVVGSGIAAHRPEALVIRENEKDVGSRLFGPRCGSQTGKRREEYLDRD